MFSAKIFNRPNPITKYFSIFQRQLKNTNNNQAIGHTPSLCCYHGELSCFRGLEDRLQPIILDSIIWCRNRSCTICSHQVQKTSTGKPAAAPDSTPTMRSSYGALFFKLLHAHKVSHVSLGEFHHWWLHRQVSNKSETDSPCVSIYP